MVPLRWRDLCGKPAAALEAPSLEDGATGPRPHAEPEAMTLLAASNVRLIGALHEGVPREGRGCFRVEVTKSWSPLSKVGALEGSFARNANESRKII
jgi:hypothetical protein